MRATLLALVVAAAAAAAAAASPAARFEFMGCYEDRLEPVDRALPLVQRIGGNMTARDCAATCFERGFRWSGAEYGEECYCGRQEPSTGRLGEDRCRMPCAGDASAACGGSLALSAYRAEEEPPEPDASRPLVALVMIVKDEAHTIESTLRTVKGHVDSFVILDTGSTDGTQDIIRRFMDGVPGRVAEEPFIDYGASRNRVMELAAAEEPPPVFTLMLSADEQVENAGHLRRFLAGVRNADGPMHGAYPVVMNSGLDFDSVRVARVDARWRYVGRVHEYLTSPEREWVQLYRPRPEVRVQFRATDDDRRYQSQFKILAILLEDLDRDANDTRAMFYAARTYSTVGNHTEAAKMYLRLAGATSWDEEEYHGLVMAASEMRDDGVAWPARHELLARAYEMRPDRMDALHMMAEDHFNEKRPHLAYPLARQAAGMPLPERGIRDARNVLLRDTSHLYEYEGQRLLGFVADRLGKHAVCARALARVLRARNGSDEYAAVVEKRCREALAAAGGRVEEEEEEEEEGAKAAAPPTPPRRAEEPRSAAATAAYAAAGAALGLAFTALLNRRRLAALLWRRKDE